MTGTTNFGGKNHLVASSPKGFSYNLLRTAVFIDICRVDKVDPGIESGMYHADSILAADLSPEVHCAEA